MAEAPPVTTGALAGLVSTAGGMSFAIAILLEKLEDVIHARGDKDDQGMFVALQACSEKLDAALDAALNLLDSAHFANHGQ